MAMAVVALAAAMSLVVADTGYARGGRRLRRNNTGRRLGRQTKHVKLSAKVKNVKRIGSDMARGEDLSSLHAKAFGDGSLGQQNPMLGVDIFKILSFRAEAWAKRRNRPDGFFIVR
jgi:hypothetical protein